MTGEGPSGPSFRLSGEGGRVANVVPPGEVGIDCYRRSRGNVRLFAAETGTLRVGEVLSLHERRDRGAGGGPVEIFRRSNAGSIREGDIVEAAGNTRSQDERTVRLVRKAG